MLLEFEKIPIAANFIVSFCSYGLTLLPLHEIHHFYDKRRRYEARNYRFL